MMRISDFIEVLTACKKSVGDLPVRAGLESVLTEITHVVVPKDKKTCVIVIDLCGAQEDLEKLIADQEKKHAGKSSQGSEKKVRSDKSGRASKPNKVQSAKNRRKASVPARRGKKTATVGKRKAAPVRAGKKKVERKSKA